MKNKKLNNKRGSVTIFLTSILLSMILASGFFLEAASGKASRSISEGVMNLAAESLLTEYQRTLKRDYGLFGFLGEKSIMEDKLRMYAEATFKSEYMDLLRLELKIVTVDLADYSLSRLDVFEEEIKKYMLYKGATLILDKALNQEDAFAEIKKGKEIAGNSKREEANLKERIKAAEAEEKEGSQNENHSDSDKKVEQGKKKLNELRSKSDADASGEVSKVGEGQIIKNKRVIEYLPSKNLKDNESGSFLQNPDKLIATTQYILNTLHNSLTNERKRQGFYQNEIEYIINGDLDDGKNFEAVKRELMIMRLGLNMAHIYSSPDKLNKISVAATALTPGPWVPLTQLVLASIWATVESTNDLKLLMDGKKVPLLKSEKNWMIDLESILNGAIGQGAIGKGEEGQDYRDYLGIMLGVVGRSDLLLRTMDIIQINIKGTDDATFKMQDYYVGFNYGSQLEKESGFFGPMGKGFRKGDIIGEIRY